jgi:hypothetical protein
MGNGGRHKIKNTIGYAHKTMQLLLNYNINNA